MNVRAVLGVAWIALATGCPLLDVEAEFENLLITYPAVEVPAVEASEATHIERSFVVDDLQTLEKIGEIVRIGGEVALMSADLRPTSGITDIAFVHRATVTVTSGDPDSTLPPLTYACDGNCTPENGVLAIGALDSENVLAYVQSGSILVDIAIDGDLPTVDWTMDVDLRFRGRVTAQVDP